MFPAAWYLMVMAMVSGGAPHRHVVEMKGFRFEPAVVRVAEGDTIVWENRDIVPHTATAADKSWDSGNVPAQSRAITIVRGRGEQSYSCLYHSGMKGKLVVR